jgi:glycosyltransferase involved in cell wall biosynthesis
MVNVAVWVITYNHEQYIKKCIDSILNQICENIEIKVFIGCDRSSDQTLEILQSKFDRDDVVILERKSRFGYHQNFFETLKAIPENFDYVATCEGDDYWCDDNKLQKQVSFLENNRDYFMTFHNGYTELHRQISKNSFSKFRVQNENESREINSTEIIGSPMRFTHLSSLVFRNKLENIISILSKRFTESPVLDTPLIDIFSTYGRNFYFAEKMFVERVHPDSITKSTSFDHNYCEQVCNMLDEIDKVLAYQFTSFLRVAKNGRKFILNLNNFKRKNFPNNLPYFFKIFVYLKYTNYSFRDIIYILRH